MADSSSLIEAVRDGDLARVRASVEAGAASHALAEALGRAAELGRVAAADYLVSVGAEVNARLWRDYTPLHLAASSRELRMVEYLLDRGADVNARDEGGVTPLHVAVDAVMPWNSDHAIDHPSHLALIEALLSRGADPTIAVPGDGTVMDTVAAVKGPGVEPLLRLLRQYGARSG
jgi:ankyrin repeat protein